MLRITALTQQYAAIGVANNIIVDMHELGLCTIKRVLGGSLLILSDVKKPVLLSRITTVGWDRKLKDAPIYVVNEKQYQNRIPPEQRKLWWKKEIEMTSSKQEKSLAEQLKSGELMTETNMMKKGKR